MVGSRRGRPRIVPGLGGVDGFSNCAGKIVTFCKFKSREVKLRIARPAGSLNPQTDWPRIPKNFIKSRIEDYNVNKKLPMG
jgi:hypothetical protein